jgi:methionyl-tRNA formyltransferase
MKSVVFLGSKPIGFECLQELINYQQQGKLTLLGVLSNDNTSFDATKSVIKLAQQHQIPVINDLNDIPTCDILYSVQYHLILKQQHIDKAKLALNLHMAPLPDYRGANQFSFAILDNKKEFGTTIHKMDAKIDHGDIAFEKRFDIPVNCWIADLYALTHQHSVDLFKESLEAILNNEINFKPQQTLVAKRGTSLHFKNEIKTIKQIDLNWSADKIEKHIRATAMPGFEPPYCMIDNKKVYFNTNE